MRPCALSLDKGPDQFAQVVGADTNVELMYVLASSWSGYLQANSEDWGAIADLPKIEVLLDRVVQLDPNHDQGQAYVYLGVLNSLRPEAIGGKPELGRSYFEKAIADLRRQEPVCQDAVRPVLCAPGIRPGTA